MSDKDGGKAFPQYAWNNWEEKVTASGGMTLRDYFAAKAMQGLLANHKVETTPYDTAYLAHLMADAMLEARK